MTETDRQGRLKPAPDLTIVHDERSHFFFLFSFLGAVLKIDLRPASGNKEKHSKARRDAYISKWREEDWNVSRSVPKRHRRQRRGTVDLPLRVMRTIHALNCCSESRVYGCTTVPLYRYSGTTHRAQLTYLRATAAAASAAPAICRTLPKARLLTSTVFLSFFRNSLLRLLRTFQKRVRWKNISICSQILFNLNLKNPVIYLVSQTKHRRKYDFESI